MSILHEILSQIHILQLEYQKYIRDHKQGFCLQPRSQDFYLIMLSC